MSTEQESMEFRLRKTFASKGDFKQIVGMFIASIIIIGLIAGGIVIDNNRNWDGVNRQLDRNTRETQAVFDYVLGSPFGFDNLAKRVSDLEEVQADSLREIYRALNITSPLAGERQTRWEVVSYHCYYWVKNCNPFDIFTVQSFEEAMLQQREFFNKDLDVVYVAIVEIPGDIP